MTCNEFTGWLRALTRVAAVLVAGVAMMAVGAVFAEEPSTSEDKPEATAEAKPLPRLGAASSSSKKTGLAAFAAKAQLKGTTTEDGKVKISNGNLSESAGGGTLSTGGGVSNGVKAKKKDADKTIGDAEAEEPTAEEKWTETMDEQKKKIESMEKNLADYDKRVDENKDAQMSNNVQNRAPGVVDPNYATRERVNEEIAAEKAKLDKMRRDARRDGVDTRKRK